MKACFFIGHRDAPSSIYPALREVVKRHITEQGVRQFYVGHYGAFDRMAAGAVRDAKNRHPELILSLLIPYHPAERSVAVPEGFDNTFYPPGMEKVPRRLAIVRANRYMVDHADYLIAYAWQPASNSRNLLEYALTRERNDLITVTALHRNQNKYFP